METVTGHQVVMWEWECPNCFTVNEEYDKEASVVYCVECEKEFIIRIVVSKDF